MTPHRSIISFPDALPSAHSVHSSASPRAAKERAIWSDQRGLGDVILTKFGVLPDCVLTRIHDHALNLGPRIYLPGRRPRRAMRPRPGGGAG